jgi:hypothetical protein
VLLGKRHPDDSQQQHVTVFLCFRCSASLATPGLHTGPRGGPAIPRSALHGLSEGRASQGSSGSSPRQEQLEEPPVFSEWTSPVAVGHPQPIWQDTNVSPSKVRPIRGGLCNHRQSYPLSKPAPCQVILGGCLDRMSKYSFFS